MAADTVGFIGLGNMGIPMTRRLVEAGYHVRGFDTSTGALGNFAAIGTSGAGGGVTAVTEIGSVGDGADAVVLMLPDSDIVERVLLGRLTSEPAIVASGKSVRRSSMCSVSSSASSAIARCAIAASERTPHRCSRCWRSPICTSPAGRLRARDIIKEPASHGHHLAG